MRKMKDSGVEWIGEIPDEWSVCRLKYLATVSSGEYISKEEFDDLGQYPIIGANGEIGRSNKRNLKKLSVITGRVGTIGTSYKVQDAWVTDNALIIQSNNMNTDFLCFSVPLFDCSYLIAGTAMPLITSTKIKNQYLCLPNIDAQCNIAKTLNIKTTQIERLIANQEEQIEKLKSYKQSLITETVTRGLDPTVPMKDSGIEWIGKIPQHWEILPLKNLFTFGKGLPITRENLIENGIAVVSYGQIHAKWNSGTTLHNELKRFVSSEYLKTNPGSLVKKGDFIMADTSEDKEGCGNCAFVDVDELIFAGYHTIILKSNSSKENKYFAYLFLTDIWRNQIRKSVSGVKLFSISRKILGSTTVSVPPLSEQSRIAEYLDKRCGEIDKLVAIKEAKIERLREYKKSLIFEYVTGKREVV